MLPLVYLAQMTHTCKLDFRYSCISDSIHCISNKLLLATVIIIYCTKIIIHMIIGTLTSSCSSLRNDLHGLGTRAGAEPGFGVGGGYLDNLYGTYLCSAQKNVCMTMPTFA